MGEKKPPSFEWAKGEKIFNYTKTGAIFADKRCDFGGGKATKKEQAVLYDGGSETYDLSGFLWDTPNVLLDGDVQVPRAHRGHQDRLRGGRAGHARARLPRPRPRRGHESRGGDRGLGFRDL